VGGSTQRGPSEEPQLARFHAPAIHHSVGQKLVDEGLLSRETGGAQADVILVGGAFRYLPAFWERVGALTRDESGRGWVVGARTPEAQASIRDRFAQVWKSAGAPEGWARVEASAALEALMVNGPSPAWSADPA
jgi:hypothetical protein